MRAKKENVYDSVNLTKDQADEILQDALPIIEGMDDLPSKSTRNLSVTYERAKILFDMVKDIYKGEYKALDKLAAATAVLAIVYLVSPIDTVPDIIPGVGFVDDIAILSFAVGLCAKEIKRYTEFKANQGLSEDTVIDKDPYK